MSYTNGLDDPSAYFQAYAFSKSSGAGSATFDGNSDLQPDFLWVKSRSNEDSHELWDSTRGVSSTLFSNVTEAEDTSSGRLSSFNTDGFTWGTAGNLNAAGDVVSWAWKANAGSTSSNTNGDITSTVQADTTAGFSIVTYTGTGTAATIGHGLGVAPDMYIVKNRDQTGTNWTVFHKDLTSNAYSLYLNNSSAQSNSVGYWNGTSPTSTVFSIKNTSGDVNTNTEDYVVYCFAEKQGYSKFGKYTGNGSTDGTFVYTGFKPACVITKEISSAGGNWRIFDSARIGYNDDNYRLTPNEASAESTAVHLDLLSNGFKFRNTGTSYNGSGDSYIFAAFAENPFVSSTGIPTTAR